MSQCDCKDCEDDRAWDRARWMAEEKAKEQAEKARQEAAIQEELSILRKMKELVLQNPPKHEYHDPGLGRSFVYHKAMCKTCNLQELLGYQRDQWSWIKK